MASGKLLRQLIKYGARGDVVAFRAAAEAAIEEERQKQHHLLANDLERLLYGEHMALDGRLRQLRPTVELPRAKDGDLPLLEERPVVREEDDIVLAEPTRMALQEIIREHQRADVLRAHGLQLRNGRPLATEDSVEVADRGEERAAVTAGVSRGVCDQA